MEKWKLEAGVTNFTTTVILHAELQDTLVQESFHLTLEVFIQR
jgi:hypothetical protein